MLDCFLTANSSFKTKDSKRCKSRRISSPLLLKRHKFCKVSSAFPISVWVGLSIGSSNTSIISRLSSPLVSSSLSDRTDSSISSSVSELSVLITFIWASIISWAVKSWGTNVGSVMKMMIMMMNCFCGMVDRREAFSLIYSRDHCQRSSPSRISNTLRASRVWTCAGPEFRLSWMKLCSSDNHYITAPLS